MEPVYFGIIFMVSKSNKMSNDPRFKEIVRPLSGDEYEAFYDIVEEILLSAHPNVLYSEEYTKEEWKEIVDEYMSNSFPDNAEDFRNSIDTEILQSFMESEIY